METEKYVIVYTDTESHPRVIGRLAERQVNPWNSVTLDPGFIAKGDYVFCDLDTIKRKATNSGNMMRVMNKTITLVEYVKNEEIFSSTGG